MGEVKRERVVGQSMVLKDGSKRDKALGANLQNICRKEMTGSYCVLGSRGYTCNIK